MRISVQDAPQKAMSFLVSQALRIEREVYQVRYQDIQYQQLVPVDQTGPEWAVGVTYFSADAVGRAKWFAARGDDVQHAEVVREKFEAIVSMASIGYDYDIQELAQSSALGIDLKADKANAARRAAEEFIDKVALTGDTTKGYTGLLNNATVTAGLAAATGTGSATTFVSKTGALVLADINAALTGMFNTSLGAEIADTLLLPYNQLLDISARTINDYSQMTILEWIRMNNVYTMTTGQPLLIRGIWGAGNLGAGSTPRMVAYRRDPSVVALYMPMAFRFLEPWQQGPLKYEVPGIFRISGVEVRRPLSMRYVDGI